MIVAYNSDTARLSQHDFLDVWGFKLAEGGLIVESGTDLFELRRDDDLEKHGWNMWSVWTIGGVILLYSKRYGKTFPKIYHIIHLIVGLLALFMTILTTCFLLVEHGIEDNYHAIMGFIVLICCIIEVILGIVGFSINKFRCCVRRWAEKEVNMVLQKMHRIVGYVLLFFAGLTVITGAHYYFEEELKDETNMKFVFLSFLLFVGVILTGEITYRISNKRSIVKVETPKDD